MATNVWTPYTARPTDAISVIFPNHSMQLLDNLVHYIGVTILTYCFAIRYYHEDLLSVRGWQSLTWPRLTILLTFFFSWIFVFTTGVLVNGIGLSFSAAACRMGIYACILFYALTKVLIYSFLAEKVYVVWAAGNSPQSRLKSPVYRICFAVMSGYIAIFVVMIVGQVSEFRGDGVCIIGLRPYSSVTLLSYDLFINVFLTSMFIWPIMRQGMVNPKLRSVAMRTLVAAAAALTTSSVNIAILTVMHGRQLGWVCLASCGTDVTLNAVVLFWVTSRGAGRDTTPLGVVPPTSPAIVSSLSEQDKRRRQSHAQGRATEGDTMQDKRYDASQIFEREGAPHQSNTKRGRGVSGWLNRMRGGGEQESRMEVQVSVFTEVDVEMQDMPEIKCEGSGPLGRRESVFSAKTDMSADLFVAPRTRRADP